MRDRVIFAGHISEAEKVDHYRLADVFVMPGWGEGFGIVYLEALAFRYSGNRQQSGCK